MNSLTTTNDHTLASNGSYRKNLRLGLPACRHRMRTSDTLYAIALFLGVFAFLCLAATGQNPDKAVERKPNDSEAKAAAAEWLEGLGKKGLVLNEKVEKRGFVVTHGQGALGRVTKFSLQEPGFRVTLAFHGELSSDTTLKTLEEKFWYATLDRLPTPGLDLPGWEVRPQTATSSIKEGVEILAYGKGKIKLRVRTNFFALYGRDPSIVVPADAGAPGGSHFQIRKQFSLNLTIEGPIAPQ